MIIQLSGQSSLPMRLRVWTGDTAKRAFDMVVSLTGLIVLAPLMGLIAIAIRRESPGPIIYRGERLQRGGSVFHILKFRTMYEVAASYAGPRVTAHDDTRITPLGHWLRDTKLNELPQLVNVLRGEMSLVGPRPEDPTIARGWPRDIWRDVLSVRPGITSPASVQYHNEESLLCEKDVLQTYIEQLGPDKSRLDQMYVRHRSFWLDLDTLLWTVLIFVPRLGAAQVPEQLLFVGPITRLIRRYIDWFTADFAVTACAIGLAGCVWRTYGALNIGWPTAIIIALAFSLLFSLTGALLGANTIAWSKAAYSDAFELVPGWALACVLAVLADRALGLLPAALVIGASFLTLGGFVATRYRSRLITGLACWILRWRSSSHTMREHVLIVGSGRTAEQVAWLLHHPTCARKLQIIGFVDDDLFTQGMRIYGSTVIGMSKDLPQLIRKGDVGLVLLADHTITVERCKSIITNCSGTAAKIAIIPDIFGCLSNIVQDPAHVIRSASVENGASGGYRCRHCLTKCQPLKR